jgi:hypothetical protein
MSWKWQDKKALVILTSEVQYKLLDFCIVHAGNRLIIVGKIKDKEGFPKTIIIPWDRVLSIETDEDFELVEYGEESDSE